LTILILPKFKLALHFIDHNGQGCAALAAIGPSKPNSLNSPVRILARFRRMMLDQDTNEWFALRIRIFDRGGDRQLKSLPRNSLSMGRRSFLSRPRSFHRTARGVGGISLIKTLMIAFAFDLA
jgi:hypothetical protein